MFIQRDLIGLLGGVNVFAYAPNPVGWVDPFGLANRPNNGKYHSFFNFQLDPSNQYSSDKVQFNRANKAFIKKLNCSKAFKKDMLKRYPELSGWIKSGNKSGSPIFGKGNDKYG